MGNAVAMVAVVVVVVVVDGAGGGTSDGGGGAWLTCRVASILLFLTGEGSICLCCSMTFACRRGINLLLEEDLEEEDRGGELGAWCA